METVQEIQTEMPVSSKEKKGIAGSTIKLIAIITMLIDHIGACILTRMLLVRGMAQVSSLEEEELFLAQNGGLYDLMFVTRMIGRLGFPIFCFLLVEGFQKTRNVKKYAMRLGLFALISEIPFDLATGGQFFNLEYQNVYFTLLVGILLLCAVEKFMNWNPAAWIKNTVVAAGMVLVPLYCAFKEVELSGMQFTMITGMEDRTPLFVAVFLGVLLICIIVAVVYRLIKGKDKTWQLMGNAILVVIAMFIAGVLKTDYAGGGVLTIFMIYLFRKRKVLSATAGCVVLTLMSFTEITSFLTLIPIAKYNGKRGLNLKYVFYAFYPVHLFLLWAICALMGMGFISAI